MALGNSRKVVGVRFLFSQNEIECSKTKLLKGAMSYCCMVRLATMGRSIKAVRDNFSCIGGARALGFIEPDDNYLSGENYYNYKIYKDINVCKDVAQSSANCSHKVYGMEIMALENFTQPPDVILFVLNTYQVMRVLQGYAYMQGANFTLTTCGNQAVCAECTARPFIFDSINLSPFCSGTRYFANWGDDELMLGVSASKLPLVLEGIYETINAMDLDKKKEEIKKRMLEKQLDFDLKYKCNYFMNNAK